MPKESFISREVFSTKFPTIYYVDAKFHYNFFTTNETTEDAEKGDRAIGSRPVDTSVSDAIDRRVLQKRIPRYVIISFRGAKTGTYLEFDNEARTGLVAQNKNNINLESHLTTHFFTTGRYQDQRLRSKIMKQVMRLADMSKIDLRNEAEVSQSDVADTVDAVTGDYISKDVLIELIHDELFEDFKFANQVEEIPRKNYDNGQEFKATFQIDTRFISDIYGVNNCKLNRGIKGVQHVDKLRAIQDEARSVSMAAINMDVDYEPSVNIIGDSEEVDEHVVPKMASVGYVITKSKMVKGIKQLVENFYIDGVHLTQFIDTKIAYGQTYVYEVSTVSIVEMTMDVEEDNEEPAIRLVRFLVQSNPSRDKKILCVEDKTPIPPDSIFYRYDYDRDSLAIDWRHPVTPQRDIKGFQVFRRKSINEPFVLQKQFNFNDAAFKYPTGENVSPNLVHESTYPVLAYEDLEFDRDSSYIYTVCSVDAHGFLSNYGTQTLVSFDRNANRIRLRNISQPGAPRQYPNMYISPTEAQNINGIRLTEDVIRDSMHTKMRVYFDPEHYRVSSGPWGNRRDMKHLANVSDGGVYKFEVLNLDRQKSKTLTIKLKNMRNK